MTRTDLLKFKEQVHHEIYASESKKDPTAATMPTMMKSVPCVTHDIAASSCEPAPTSREKWLPVSLTCRSNDELKKKMVIIVKEDTIVHSVGSPCSSWNIVAGTKGVVKCKGQIGATICFENDREALVHPAQISNLRRLDDL